MEKKRNGAELRVRNEFHKEKIGKEIKNIREAKKLSVRELALKSGVSERYLYYLENYNAESRKLNPTLENLISIALALEIPLIKLLEFSLPASDLELRINDELKEKKY